MADDGYGAAAFDDYPPPPRLDNKRKFDGFEDRDRKAGFSGPLPDFPRKTGFSSGPPPDRERKTGFSAPPSDFDRDAGLPGPPKERKSGFSGPPNDFDRETGLSGPPKEPERRKTGFSGPPNDYDRETGFSGPPKEQDRRKTGFSSPVNDYDREAGFTRPPASDHQRKTGFSGPPGSDHERKTGFAGPPGGVYDRKTGFSAPSDRERKTGFAAPPGEHERKTGFSGSPASYSSIPPPVGDIEVAKQRAEQIAARLVAQDVKRPRTDDNGDGHPPHFHSSATTYEHRGYGREDLDRGPTYQGQHGASPYDMQGNSPSKKIDVPNIKVGLIIGKAGETIKYLQNQSGARIQVTRDADHDPHASTRQVELMGTPEQISRAEQLIKDVLAEADAGGSTAIVSRGHGGPPPFGEQIQIRVPNNKVGLIIGRGGETIKSLQSRTGARIQLVPLQHSGDAESNFGLERVVTLLGSKQQTDMASELIKEVISESRQRGPPMSSGYNQQGYRPPGPPQWAPPGAPSMQPQGYGYQQSGSHVGPPQQYPSQSQPYGGYAQQPSTGFTSGWNQRPTLLDQQSHQTSSYDYYNQSSQPVSAPNDSNSAYNQSQGGYAQQASHGQQGYGQQAPGSQSFGQSGPGQQPYGQAYGQQPYGQAGTMQPSYGQPAPSPAPSPPGYSQQSYGQQGVSPSGYGQQPLPPQQGSTQPGYTHQGPSQQAFGQQGTAQSGHHQQGPTQPAGFGQQMTAQTNYAQQEVAEGGPRHGGSAQSGHGTQGPSQHGYGQQGSGYGQQASASLNQAPGSAQPSYTHQGSVQSAFGHDGLQQGFGHPRSVPQGSVNTYEQQGGAHSGYGAYNDGYRFPHQPHHESQGSQHGYAQQGHYDASGSEGNGDYESTGPPQSGGGDTA